MSYNTLGFHDIASFELNVKQWLWRQMLYGNAGSMEVQMYTELKSGVQLIQPFLFK